MPSRSSSFYGFFIHSPDFYTHLVLIWPTKTSGEFFDMHLFINGLDRLWEIVCVFNLVESYAVIFSTIWQYGWFISKNSGLYLYLCLICIFTIFKMAVPLIIHCLKHFSCSSSFIILRLCILLHISHLKPIVAVCFSKFTLFDIF